MKPANSRIRSRVPNDAGEIGAALCADCAAEVQCVAADFVHACADAAGERGRELAIERVAEIIDEAVAEMQAAAPAADKTAARRQGA